MGGQQINYFLYRASSVWLSGVPALVFLPCSQGRTVEVETQQIVGCAYVFVPNVIIFGVDTID